MAWLAALGLPLGAPVVLRLADGLDRSWYGDAAHFWLVLIDGVIAAGLGLSWMSEAGRRRVPDARVVLAVGPRMPASAGFRALHALATPGVLLDHPQRRIRDRGRRSA